MISITNWNCFAYFLDEIKDFVKSKLNPVKHYENIIRIKVSKDFSPFPDGAYYSSFCGENFRKNHLFQPLSQGCKVIVDLDGTNGYDSPWLKEAFGGLVVSGFDKEYLSKMLTIVSKNDSSLETECWQYIFNAV